MKAVISGASRGIGKAIAQKLAGMGYDLVLLARTQKELEKVQAELEREAQSVQILSIDLSNARELEKVVELLEAPSELTVLVNNLGIYEMDEPSTLNTTSIQKMMETNLYSAIGLTQLCLPFLEQATAPVIVNIGSVMSLQAEPIATSYSISKHAFKAWNDALREELRPQNIKVSCIYPGSVNTSSWDGIEADRNAMIQAEDVAEMVSSILKMKQASLVEEVRMSPLNFHP